jgi:hypothetical protein
VCGCGSNSTNQRIDLEQAAKHKAPPIPDIYYGRHGHDLKVVLLLAPEVNGLPFGKSILINMQQITILRLNRRKIQLAARGVPRHGLATKEGCRTRCKSRNNNISENHFFAHLIFFLDTF